MVLMNFTLLRKEYSFPFLSKIRVLIIIISILGIYQIHTARRQIMDLFAPYRIEEDTLNPMNVEKLKKEVDIPIDGSLLKKSEIAKGRPLPLPYCNSSEEVKEVVRINHQETTILELERKYQGVEKGHWKPRSCRALYKIAIIIPVRDREVHLGILLNNLIPFLANQQLDYTIFVVEQATNQTFNRAKLMNVGFAESAKIGNWDCFIFHDVDLLPEHLGNLYNCHTMPRHMSFAMNKHDYKDPYPNFFGGVTAISRNQFLQLNGMSNDYWGWGGEDDDLFTRIKLNNMSVLRSQPSLGRYTMIKHKSDQGNPVNRCRYKLLQEAERRWQMDGLNSLIYQVESFRKRPLFIHLVVDLMEPQSTLHLQHMNCFRWTLDDVYHYVNLFFKNIFN